MLERFVLIAGPCVLEDDALNLEVASALAELSRELSLPVLAGALAGLLAQEGGRQLIRLRMPPADDESRPWQRPLMLWAAVLWDPVRASMMRPNELAAELMRAFRTAVLAAGSPS